MRLPIPDPRDAIEAVTGLLPRAVGLLDAAEQLLGRVDALIARIEDTRLAADAVIERTEQVVTDAGATIERTNGVVTDANAVIVRTAGTVASVEPTLERAEKLIDSFAPALEKLQPTLVTLADTTSPHEVEAMVGLVDQLPHLVTSLDKDVLPILQSLGSVSPDIHELLNLTRELNEMLAKVPGMGRVRRRGGDRAEEALEDGER